MAMAILAYDIGGSSVKYAVIKKDGTICTKGSFVTPETLGEFLDGMVQVKKKLEKDDKLIGVGCSFPGAVDDAAGVIGGSSALPYIHGIPMKRMLEERLGLPVAMENDANCAAIGEVWTGVAKGCKDVIFLVIGTGIGGAVVKDGRIHHGCHFHGGEFGYMIVDEANTILSDAASTRVLVEETARRKKVDPKTLDGQKVFAMAENGDADAQAAVQRMYHYLGWAAYNLQYSFDPERIVLGGAVSAREDLAENVMREVEAIRKSVGVAHVRPEIVCCKNGNAANLLGAAYTFLQKK